MRLAGYLSEYSIAEIFQLIQQGNRTGSLAILPEVNSAGKAVEPFYVWFQGGRIVSMSNTLEIGGLLETISRRRWLTDGQSNEMSTKVFSLTQPLGLHLKQSGILSSEQLKLLFNAQVILPVYRLFKHHQGRFEFDPHARIPSSEMTGLSVSIPEVMVVALRALEDWSHLQDKLPDPSYGVTRLSIDAPTYRLERIEVQLLEHAKGQLTLTEIAARIDCSIEALQQAVFRLSTIGLVKEVVIESAQPKEAINARSEKQLSLVGGGGDRQQLSSSFLGNLMGFLNKKKGA
jgi:hypothetical protein